MSEVIKMKFNTVTKLSAVWCGPCKQYAPIFESAVEDLEDWNVISLDFDTPEGQAFAEKYGIRGVPATLIERQGEETRLLMGGKTKADLLQFMTGDL
jgi:thiol-disulfide isomerase/thioredoxin